MSPVHSIDHIYILLVHCVMILFYQSGEQLIWETALPNFCLSISLASFVGHPAKVVGYGHLGDGNLHLNITSPQYDDAVSFSILSILWER